MRVCFSIYLSIVAVSGLACNRAVLKHPSATVAAAIPAAIVVERSLPNTMLDEDLDQPAGMASDSNGYIYLCDRGNDRIVKLSSDLMPVRDGGGRGDDLGLLKMPAFIIVDDSQGVLVSDVDNRRIERFSMELEGIDQIVLDDPDDPLKYGHPSGLALTSDGGYRIADTDHNRVIELDNVGMFRKFIGDLGDRGGQLDSPQKVLIDNDDNLFVCDAGNARVMVYDRFNSLLRIITHESLESPVAAVFDRGGNLWVLDQTTAQIFCFSASGKLLTDKPLPVLGITPPFDRPTDLLLLKDGRLLITDSGNNRVVVCKVIPASGQ